MSAIIFGHGAGGSDLLPIQDGFIQRRAVVRVVKKMGGEWKVDAVNEEYYNLPEEVQTEEHVKMWWLHGWTVEPKRYDPDEECPSA